MTKLDQLNERLTKKNAQIVKAEAKLEKVTKELNDLPYNADKWDRQEAEWAIRSANAYLKEYREQRDNILASIEKENNRLENLRNVRKIFGEFLDAVENSWNEHDIKIHDEMIEEIAKRKEYEKCIEYRSLKWDDRVKNDKEYRHEMQKKHGDACFVLAYKKIDEIKADNKKDVERLALNTLAKLNERVGVITDTSGLRVGTESIEGYIKGTKGAVEIFSIFAGGYNIQRLHVRVLVKDR